MSTYWSDDHPRDAPPRFRLFGIGIGKTGTHSLAGLFSDRYRSAHEPDWRTLIRHCLDPDVARRGDFFMSRPLIALAASWPWEMNASTLNYHLIPLLRRLAPDAGYVLTVRDPVGWLASITRHESTRPRQSQPLWWEIRRFRFRPDLFPHRDYDRALDALGLFSIEGYLRYWRRHHANALAEVPDDRMAVVAVDDLDRPATVARLAALAGIPVDTLRPDRGRQFVSDTPFDLFAHVERDRVAALAEEICGDLWRDLQRRSGD